MSLDNAVAPAAFMLVGILTFGLSLVVVACHIWMKLWPEPGRELVSVHFLVGWSYAMVGVFTFGAIFWS